jgi:hypothetical protein
MKKKFDVRNQRHNYVYNNNITFCCMYYSSQFYIFQFNTEKL